MAESEEVDASRPRAPLTDDLIARLRHKAETLMWSLSTRALLFEAAEALAAASRPQTEQEVIDHVVSHWFTQGGVAEFGAIPECHNADEVISAILEVVRASAPPAAPPPWQPKQCEHDVQKLDVPDAHGGGFRWGCRKCGKSSDVCRVSRPLPSPRERAPTQAESMV
jgi:hypothetical protein